MTVRTSTRYSLAIRTLCLDAALIVLIAGCKEKDNADTTGTSTTGANSNPSIDVRGGNSESDTGSGRVRADGDGGDGGTISIITNGNIDIHDGALAAVAQAQTFVGNGLTVPSGERRQIASANTFDFVVVQAGGELRLIEDTSLFVAGDVLIAGRVVGRGDKHFIDGRGFQIQAGGTVNITGSIDCSGFQTDLEELSPLDRFDAPGGRGGQIVIATTSGAAPALFISGDLRADGGDSFASDVRTALPGRGGRVALGSVGSMAISGHVTARGGNCYFTLDGSEGVGGRVEITANGIVEIGEVREINANGGDGSGSLGGNGGTIHLETGGTIDLADFDIECRGGDSTFSFSGEAGSGGLLELLGGTIDLTNVFANISGGAATFEGSGVGGGGGDVIIAAGGTVAQDVVILVEGGDSLQDLASGGAGGDLQVINVTTFEGAASVEPGLSVVRSFGPDGTICAEGLNAASLEKLQGTNDIPIATDCPFTP
jgi:hypothetical protein